MSKVYLKLELQSRMGEVLKVFTKEVESAFTPTKDMIFNGEDYTLQANRVYFDLNDGTVFVLFVEHQMSGDEPSEWDFLLAQGWELAT